MTRELWIALLLFLATVITLATQMLPIPANIMPWLIFAVAAINAALTIFFGYAGIKARQAAKATSK
jgi:ABC-type Na+ efflux pump permease subunit